MEAIGERGADHSYDTTRVIAWMIQRALTKASIQSPRDRLDSLRADREALALARDLGELVPAADVERVWGEHILAARTELLALPEVVASELSARYGVVVDADLIETHILTALGKLSSLDVAEDEPEAADDEINEGESGDLM